MAAGFRSPAPWVGISSAPVVTQGGFRTPLPPFNAGSPPVVTQGGFRTPLPSFNAGSLAAVPVVSKGNLAGYPAGKAKLRNQDGHFGPPLSTIRAAFYQSLSEDTFYEPVEPVAGQKGKKRSLARQAGTPQFTFTSTYTLSGVPWPQLQPALPTVSDSTTRLVKELRNLAKGIKGSIPLDGSSQKQLVDAIIDVDNNDLLLRLLLLLEGP